MPDSQTALSPAAIEDDGVYRAVSRSAVAAMVVCGLGLLSIWLVPLLVLPAVAILLSLVSLGQFRRYPDELTGKPIALLSLLVSVVTLVGATSLHVYTYYTEVPDGYERISFSQLKSPFIELDYPPESAMALNGKQVFIKGYILPTSVTSGSASRFVIVPDIATCCFGGQPKLTHMVEVQLTGEAVAKFRLKQVRLAGTLRVDNRIEPHATLQGTYYQLKADIYRP
jgi:Protein of unknown function (DUF3299)